MESCVDQAAADYVGYGVVVARSQEVAIRRDHFQGELLHLILRQPWIYPCVEKGAIEPVEVCTQLEGFPSKRASHVVD